MRNFWKKRKQVSTRSCGRLSTTSPMAPSPVVVPGAGLLHKTHLVVNLPAKYLFGVFHLAKELASKTVKTLARTAPKLHSFNGRGHVLASRLFFALPTLALLEDRLCRWLKNLLQRILLMPGMITPYSLVDPMPVRDFHKEHR